MGDYIRQTLEEKGYDPEGLKVRYLWKPERVGTAVMTGCDRDVGGETKKLEISCSRNILFL